MALAAVLGAGTAVLPAIAASETSPNVTAENIGVYEEHRWTPPQVSVSAGGAVTFSNPTEVKHGIHWINPPATPTCDSGVPVGVTETETSARTKWSGACTFTQPGTYTYYCTVHGAAMAGRVTVSQSGVVTTPTTTTTGTTTTPTTETPSVSPIVGAPSLRFKQHGASVHGSIDVSQAGAGGRLEVDLFASGASLAKVKHPRVRVGRLVLSATHVGKQFFAVQLDAKANRALKRHRRLAVTVKITLVPVHGKTIIVTRAVLLRP